MKAVISNYYHILKSEYYKRIKKIDIKEGCRFYGDIMITGKVKLGRFVSVNGPATRISGYLYGVEIGNFVSIASNVVIQEYNHRYDKITTYHICNNVFKDSIENDIFSKGKILIEDDVWIGSNVVILSGVRIGRGSVVAAGSVVTKDIDPYSIVGGNPAKIIKKRFSEEEINYIEKLRWWEWDLHEMKKNRKLFYVNMRDTVK